MIRLIVWVVVIVNQTQSSSITTFVIPILKSTGLSKKLISKLFKANANKIAKSNYSNKANKTIKNLFKFTKVKKSYRNN